MATEHTRHTEVMIRSATALDAVNIARLLKASWENQAAAEVAQVNDQRAIEYVVELLKDSHVAVAEISGRLIGALACALTREHWSRPDDWFLVDEIFVISPHWVTRGIPERLLQEAEGFADQRQLPLLFGGSLMISFPLGPLLNQRPGFQRLGAQYLRMPQVGHHGVEEHEEMQASA